MHTLELSSIAPLKRAIISDPLPLTTVGLNFSKSKHALNRKPEAPAATGSSTQGLLHSLATCAAAFIAGSQSGTSVPTLMQSAWVLGVKSGISCSEWIIAGEAPAESRTLATRSMETKFVMHWIRGEARRTESKWAHACRAQNSGLSGTGLGVCNCWSEVLSSIVVAIR